MAIDPLGPSQAGVRGGDFVDIEDAEVVSDWTRSLGVSSRELSNAVEIVGPSAGSVYDYLRKRQQQSAAMDSARAISTDSHLDRPSQS